MSNKMIIHYCGGAGINIARAINDRLANLGSGFSEITPKYLDTSTNNLGDIDPSELWRVESNEFGAAVIDGSGGERRTNAPAIMASVKDYLDTNKFLNKVTGEYHIVVFSGSGGTGSVVAPVLISSLRERGMPVLGVFIGDSSNGLSCKNTLNTIATLDHMAKNSIKKPITTLYYNNKNSDSIEDVNDSLFNALTTMSLFFSGDNEDIDTKDMDNFISPEKYETIQIAPSLYSITIHTNNKVDNDPNVVNLIGRSLAPVGMPSDVDIALLQHKYGKIVDSNAAAVVESAGAIHIILAGNYLAYEHQVLSKTVEEYDAIAKSIITTDLSGVGEADASGLII